MTALVCDDCETSRAHGGAAVTLEISGRLKRLAAEATREHPRAAHETLWIGGRIGDLERCAVDRLLADCETIAIGLGGDRRDLVFVPAGGEDDSEPADLTEEYDALLYRVGGLDPGAIRAAPTAGEIEWRALNRAHARARAERALAAVGPDRYRLLRFLVGAGSDAALAAETGIPRGTMRDRLVSGIRALARHYEREAARRVTFPPTRATASARVVAAYYASTGPSGPTPGAAKRETPFLHLLPSVLGDYAEAAGALIETDRLQRLVLGDHGLAEHIARLDRITDPGRRPDG